MTGKFTHSFSCLSSLLTVLLSVFQAAGLLLHLSHWVNQELCVKLVFRVSAAGRTRKPQSGRTINPHFSFI